MRRGVNCGLTAILLIVASSGCVERYMKIDTRPSGARVIINDEEVGLSPVKTSFLWYGDYDIVVRKPGYKTAHTSYRIDPPWYQVPPFDLFAETMVPGVIRDEHELPVIELELAEVAPASEVVERAADMRAHALFGE